MKKILVLLLTIAMAFPMNAMALNINITDLADDIEESMSYTSQMECNGIVTAGMRYGDAVVSVEGTTTETADLENETAFVEAAVIFTVGGTEIPAYFTADVSTEGDSLLVDVSWKYAEDGSGSVSFDCPLSVLSDIDDLADMNLSDEIIEQDGYYYYTLSSDENGKSEKVLVDTEISTPKTSSTVIYGDEDGTLSSLMKKAGFDEELVVGRIQYDRNFAFSS